VDWWDRGSAGILGGKKRKRNDKGANRRVKVRRKY
jgi:hypothetical protein